MTAVGIVPDVERVAVWWLTRLTTVLATGLVAGAATTLPQTDASGQWGGKPVFLLVSGAPGVPNKVSPFRSNMARVDALAGRGKLGQVSSIGEMIHNATYTLEGCGIGTPAPRNLQVDLRDVSIFSTPRQIRGDGEALARVTMMVQLTYSIISLGG